LWEDKSQKDGDEVVPFDGIPFVILGFDVRECHFGPDRNEKKKKIFQLEKVCLAYHFILKWVPINPLANQPIFTPWSVMLSQL
jgi:hypothetical protein